MELFQNNSINVIEFDRYQSSDLDNIINSEEVDILVELDEDYQALNPLPTRSRNYEQLVKIQICSTNLDESSTYWDYIIVNDHLLSKNHHDSHTTTREKLVPIPYFFINPELYSHLSDETQQEMCESSDLRAEYNIPDDAFVYGWFQ